MRFFFSFRVWVQVCWALRRPKLKRSRLLGFRVVGPGPVGLKLVGFRVWGLGSS